MRPDKNKRFILWKATPLNEIERKFLSIEAIKFYETLCNELQEQYDNKNPCQVSSDNQVISPR